jgi:E3 ubiquitin-protein ligase RFWD2
MPIVAARKTLIDARQCPICLETYKAPFQVNCGHTFCHECVLAHVLGHGWDRKREFLRARADDDDDDDDDDSLNPVRSNAEVKKERKRTRRLMKKKKKKKDIDNDHGSSSESKSESKSDNDESSSTDDDDDDDDDDLLNISSSDEDAEEDRADVGRSDEKRRTRRTIDTTATAKKQAECPICAQEITRITPNLSLTKVCDAMDGVDAVTMRITEEHSPMEPQHSKIARAEKVVSALEHMDAEQLEPILKALIEKHSRAVMEEETKRVEILNDFFGEALGRKQKKMRATELELECLRADITKVEECLKSELKALKRSYEQEQEHQEQHQQKEEEEKPPRLTSIDTTTTTTMTTTTTTTRTTREKEEEENDDDDNHDADDDENINDMMRYVPQQPRITSDDDDETFERKYFNGLSSLYAKGFRELVVDSSTNLPPTRPQDSSSSQKHNQQQQQCDVQSIDELNEDRLEDFAQALTDARWKYRRVRVVAEIMKPSLSLSSLSFNNNSLVTLENNQAVAAVPPAVNDIVSSIDVTFDRTMFATAGVSKRIEFYTFSDFCDRSARNEDGERPSRVKSQIRVNSKISCLSFSRMHISRIAASDYEGVVTIWDAETSQSIQKFEEHDKRCWTVEYCRCIDNMHLLASGSDDGAVKIWSESGISMGGGNRSVMELNMRANVCCIAWSPTSAHDIAIGCADHKVRVFDLRKPNEPVFSLSSHKKAVSYVKYINSSELCSASTDSSVCIWDVKKSNSHVIDANNENNKNGSSNNNNNNNNNSTRLIRTLTGHMNRKNFVGLATSSDGKSVACGSETNEVFIYNKNFSSPLATVSFDGPGMKNNNYNNSNNNSRDPILNHFVSAVCWSDESTLISANSRGRIKIINIGGF